MNSAVGTTRRLVRLIVEEGHVPSDCRPVDKRDIEHIFASFRQHYDDVASRTAVSIKNLERDLASMRHQIARAPWGTD